ncbi:helix-turn-helix domain-containing protein [Acinetobacter sp. ANC 4640]
MSVDATRWAWLAPVKSSTQRLVLLSLADRAGEYHTCFPSVARITKDTKLNRKTIMKVIGELIELGLVEDTGHKKGATKQVIVYRLLGIKTREDEEINSTNIGTVPKTEQSQNYQETVPFLPHNSTNIGTQNLKGTKKESKNINTAFSFKDELKNLGAEKQLIEDWMTVRTSKKAKQTKTAFDGFIREFNKSGLPINTVLRICIEKNWQGFNCGWLSNINLADYQTQPEQQTQSVPRPALVRKTYKEAV